MTRTPTFAFGLYLYIPQRQLLLRNGKPVRVGCRALDLLTAFVQSPGQLLTKRALLEGVWPSTTVVEGNLKVHVAALRRALDDDVDAAKYIATVNGRGYRFIAPVECGEALMTFAGSAQAAPLVLGVERASIGPSHLGFEGVVGLLAEAIGSVALDPAGLGEPNLFSAAPRRVLFIELTAREEALIENVFAQRLGVISATR